jgi:glucose uptake protein GlcU
MRAVGGVIGFMALLIGGTGVFRGWLTRAEWIAVICGLVLILIVAIIPAGKPRSPLYDDWDRPRSP